METEVKEISESRTTITTEEDTEKLDLSEEITV